MMSAVRCSSCAAVLLMSIVVVVVVVDVAAHGAGRAFPVAAENFAIENFQRVNHNINWDHTNYLVDLAGHYANCKVLLKPLGVISITRTTLLGEPINLAVDTIAGRGHDAGTVILYIEEIVKRWMISPIYNTQIRRSSCFGCSVRPGCNDFAVVACLFANSSTCLYQQNPENPNPISDAPTTRRNPPPTTTTSPVPNPTPAPTTTTTTARPTFPRRTTSRLILTDRPIAGDQAALAFTPQQYKVAEGILGKSWDRSHYLENLSGFETRCEMIRSQTWHFSYTEKFNDLHELSIKGVYGFARNVGSTPDALLQIVPNFKQQIGTAKDLGCSLIPDCIVDDSMWVVVSCLYE